MKRIALGLIFISQMAFAGQLENDIRELAELVNTGTNGGEVVRGKYDGRKFNYKSLLGKMVSEADELSDCRMTVAAGKRSVMGGSFEILDSEARSLLENLIANNQVRGILGFYWDSFEGNPESCSYERLDIYFINNESLIIYHDSTT